MIRQPKWLHLSLALALVVVVASPALATVKIKSVSPDQKQLVVTDKDGKDWTYHATDNMKIFMPGNKEGKLSDLKAGEDISLLWEKRGEQFFADAILLQQGDLKDAMLAQGTVKKVDASNNQVMVTDRDNKEWTYHFTDKGRVTLGTKQGKLSDLKDNDKVIVVYEKKGDQYLVRDICAERR
jgi:Cu/Ag efflux protein CusF